MNIKVGVLIEKDNKVLLIKEKIKKKNKPLWNIVKGTYEKDLFLDAERECMEEASVRVELTHLLGIYISGDKMQFTFIGKIISGEPKIPGREKQEGFNEDIREIKWFKKEIIQNMSKDEYISNRTYQALNDWVKGKRYPLEIFKDITV